MPMPRPAMPSLWKMPNLWPNRMWRTHPRKQKRLFPKPTPQQPPKKKTRKQINRRHRRRRFQKIHRKPRKQKTPRRPRKNQTQAKTMTDFWDELLRRTEFYLLLIPVIFILLWLNTQIQKMNLHLYIKNNSIQTKRDDKHEDKNKR